jgi:hypothetical protein
MLAIVIGMAALLATLGGVYYSRGQLREAEKVREQNQIFAEKQAREDDLWADKCVKAGTLLCQIADWDRPDFFGGGAGKRAVYLGGNLEMLFGRDVRKHILGQLIEKQNDNTYTLRPIDVSQLRLKATRDLIDMVLATVEKFQKQKPGEAKELGL